VLPVGLGEEEKGKTKKVDLSRKYRKGGSRGMDDVKNVITGALRLQEKQKKR